MALYAEGIDNQLDVECNGLMENCCKSSSTTLSIQIPMLFTIWHCSHFPQEVVSVFPN